jgi:hypothetical protein
MANHHERRRSLNDLQPDQLPFLALANLPH